MSASLFVACAFLFVFSCGVAAGYNWTVHAYSKRARRQAGVRRDLNEQRRWP